MKSVTGNSALARVFSEGERENRRALFIEAAARASEAQRAIVRQANDQIMAACSTSATGSPPRKKKD